MGNKTLREVAKEQFAARVREWREWADETEERAAIVGDQFPDIVALDGDEIEVQVFARLPTVHVRAWVAATDWYAFISAAAEVARHYGCVPPYRKLKEAEGGFCVTAMTKIGVNGVLGIAIRPGTSSRTVVLRPPTCRFVKRTMPAYEVEEIVCEREEESVEALAAAGVAVAEEMVRA